MNLTDYLGNNIRFTDERRAHIKEHPEMVAHIEKINGTLKDPEIVVKSKVDDEVSLYYKQYQGLSIGDKYLCVIADLNKDYAFKFSKRIFRKSFTIATRN